MSIAPEEFARSFVRRPGMHLGEVSFERAVGYLLGLEAPLMQACRTPEEVASLPSSRHRALLQRDPADDELTAIARLEPVLAGILVEIQRREEGC